uniref:C-type lectin domain-containing protein n=1 Tax=Plectus sambesii TaxID=2011161 RepID=A0A914XKA0_9BILA
MISLVSSTSLILCVFLCRLEFDSGSFVSALTIPTLGTFKHVGFSYYTNSWFVLQEVTTNQWTCILLCQRNVSCFSLAHNSATNACQLHAVPADNGQFKKDLIPNSQYKLFIRQLQPETTCPDSGWRYLASSKKCYQYFHPLLSFYDAEKECNTYGYGGHLIQPSTNEELDQLNMNNTRGAYTGIVWQDTPAGAFYYLDGRLAVWPSAVGWYGGGTYSGREDNRDCIATTNGNNPPWYQYWAGSGTEYPYTCELPIV